ncbi:MAG TPA: DUF559 domain-containing protein [Solirubrobacterales bacterium]|nr:DUF559 domain-containing protein [Solirubrobacterales bacterium]
MHWELLRPLDGPIDVTVPKRTGRSRRPGIRIYRRPDIEWASSPTNGLQTRPPRPVTVRQGVPVTTVARTLEDLRRSDLRPSLVRRAIRQAEFLRLPLGEIATDGTRSDLERDFLRLCRNRRLPTPEVNVRIGRMTVDFLWRSAMLVVETDSYVTHGGTVAFEDDRQRDLALRRLGYSVHRYSERQLEREPEAAADDVAAALGLIIAA